MSEFVVHDGNGVRWEPVREQMMIGRGWDNDLRLRSSVASRRHAWVWRRGDQVVIEDLGSMHGTFVNGQLLRGPRLLHQNDVVAIGDARLTYVAQRELYMEPGAPPPGGQAWSDANRTPPMGVRHLMISQSLCARCGAPNHPVSRHCIRCGSPLLPASNGDPQPGEEAQPMWPVQRTTPTEPVVAQPFPQAGGGAARQASTEKGIWALAIIMAILTVILLMTLGVLLILTLA